MSGPDFDLESPQKLLYLKFDLLFELPLATIAEKVITADVVPIPLFP
jgi:hypothetical protein